MTDPKPSDPLGLRPFAESVKIVTQGAVDGAAAFLGRICLPAAEEFGLLLRDRVSGWRARNAATIARQAEALLERSGRTNRQAHPRLAVEIIDKGSWTQDDELQKAWAGLLASSCTEDGLDDSNVLFVSLLEQLTGAQIRVLDYASATSRKFVTKAGWIHRQDLEVTLDQLMQITGVSDFHRLDRELDHLRALGLIGGGFSGGFHPEEHKADISPTALALNLYVRCQGFVGSPVEYWGVTELMPEISDEV